MITQSDKNEIVMMYRQAANRKKQIAIMSELYLCTKQEITEILKEAGLITDAKSIPRGTSKRVPCKRWRLWTDEEETILCDMRRNGESYKEISAVLGRSFQSVSNKAKCLGL